MCVSVCVREEMYEEGEIQRQRGKVSLGFMSLSTIVGYLISNPVYTYIKYMICKQIVFR